MVYRLGTATSRFSSHNKKHWKMPCPAGISVLLLPPVRQGEWISFRKSFPCSIWWSAHTGTIFWNLGTAELKVTTGKARRPQPCSEIDVSGWRLTGFSGILAGRVAFCLEPPLLGHSYINHSWVSMPSIRESQVTWNVTSKAKEPWAAWQNEAVT